MCVREGVCVYVYKTSHSPAGESDTGQTHRRSIAEFLLNSDFLHLGVCAVRCAEVALSPYVELIL